MNKVNTAIAALIILLVHTPTVRCQTLLFISDDMRVYMTADDFYNNHYLEADKTTNLKHFRKDKVNVAERKEAWGVSSKMTDDVYPLYRSYNEGQVDVLLVIQCGTICLYGIGQYFIDKTGKGTIVFESQAEPMLFSAGLDGEIMKVNRKNLETAMNDDPQALQKIESTIKNVSANAQEYLDTRMEIVRFYNKRHPSGKIEFDLTAPKEPTRKKKN